MMHFQFNFWWLRLLAGLGIGNAWKLWFWDAHPTNNVQTDLSRICTSGFGTAIINIITEVATLKSFCVAFDDVSHILLHGRQTSFVSLFFDADILNSVRRTLLNFQTRPYRRHDFLDWLRELGPIDICLYCQRILYLEGCTDCCLLNYFWIHTHLSRWI